MPRNILVVNMNYLGDALMTTPALSALRDTFPDARIDTIVGAGAPVEVLRDNPDLDHVIPRQARGSFARCLELFQLLRRGRYTDVILMPPLPAYAVTAWLAGTLVRVGRADRGMNPFLTLRLPTQAAHMVDAMLDAVPVAQEMRENRRLRVALTLDDRADAQSLLSNVGLADARPLVAVNLGATRPQKRWFAASFAAALDDLADVACVLIGAGAADAELAEEILILTKRARPVNLVGRTGVKQLAAVLERCDALLTADSGPMHLATAVGTPTVSLFGSTDPALTGPYDQESRVLYKQLPCAPCGNHPTCEGRYDCMREITPTEAALAVLEVLRAGRRPGLVLPMAAIRSRLSGGEVRETIPAFPTEPIASARPAPLVRDNLKAAPRILIVTKFRFIGDTLLAIPIFRAARAQWPNARLTLLTGRNARVLLQNNPYLDEIIEFDPNRRDHGVKPFVRLLRRLRRERFDLCLTLNRSFHSALIPWLAGIGTRAGFCSEGRSFLLNRRVPYEYDGDQSEIACYFEVLRAAAPAVPVHPALELWVSPEEEQEAAQSLRHSFGEDAGGRRLIGLQPGASLPSKRWPVERFIQVAEAIIRDDRDARLILVGGSDEREAATAMWEGMSPETRSRAADFVGAFDLRGSLAMVSQLSLFLGNDTAVMHSAVALGVPTVALFGPTNPRKWGNYGPRHRVLEAPNGMMTGLPCADVLTAVRDLMESAEPCMAASASGIIQDT